MLFYLDQWQSTVDSTAPTPRGAAQRPGARSDARASVARAPAPPRSAARRAGLNENYARELLELHTLGVDGGYTQQDVIEVARALTGWTMNPRQEARVRLPSRRSTTPDEKIVLGHRLAAGRGIEDGEEVLDILARIRRPRTSSRASSPCAS